MVLSKKRIGMLLLAGWLIAASLLHLVPGLAFAGSENILALVGLAAGVLVLLER